MKAPAEHPAPLTPEEDAASRREVTDRLDRIRRAGQVSWAIVGITAVLTLVGFVAWAFKVVIPPLILAWAIVIILNPVVNWFQSRRIPRALGALFAYLLVAGIVAALVVLISPVASRQTDDLVERWETEIQPDLENRLNDLCARAEAGDWFIQIPCWDDLGETFTGEEETTLAERFEQIREFGLRVFHVLLIFVLGPIIAFYLLVDLPHLRRVADSLIPERSKAEVLLVARRLNRAVTGFLRGQLLVALIVGSLVSFGLWIIGLPVWFLVGMIAGFFNMIPLIGPYIGGIPGVIIAFTAGDGLTQAIWVAVIMVIAQQIDNHFITPNVMQRVVKLHPAAVMLALLAGGTLGGIYGILISVPVAAILKILIGHTWRTYVLGEPLEVIAAADAEADDGGLVDSVLDAESVAAAREEAAQRVRFQGRRRRTGAGAATATTGGGGPGGGPETGAPPGAGAGPADPPAGDG